MLLNHVRTAITSLILFTLVTGVAYPLAVTGIAQLLFPEKANGSFVEKDGKLLGSELIGQQFSNPKYFWSRPSLTSPYAYNASASSGSNYGPLNTALLDAVSKRVHVLKSADPGNMMPIPVDLVTASGSGLDPHISAAAAQYQVSRVARTRGISEEKLRALLGEFTERRQLGFLGETRVNVLKLNLALDELKSQSQEK